MLVFDTSKNEASNFKVLNKYGSEIIVDIKDDCNLYYCHASVLSKSKESLNDISIKEKIENIEKPSKLHDSGVLSYEEFVKLKNEAIQQNE